MLVGTLVVALSLVCCSAVSADDVWTEQQIQQSKKWKDGRAPLIFTRAGTAPLRDTGCSPADMTAAVGQYFRIRPPSV